MADFNQSKIVQNQKVDRFFFFLFFFNLFHASFVYNSDMFLIIRKKFKQ